MNNGTGRCGQAHQAGQCGSERRCEHPDEEEKRVQGKVGVVNVVYQCASGLARHFPGRSVREWNGFLRLYK